MWWAANTSHALAVRTLCDAAGASADWDQVAPHQPGVPAGAPRGEICDGSVTLLSPVVYEKNASERNRAREKNGERVTK